MLHFPKSQFVKPWALISLFAVTSLALPLSALADESERYNGYVYDQARDQYCKQNDSQNGGVVMGALAGGVVGNAVSGKRNKSFGTVAGAIIGAIVGSEVSRSPKTCIDTGYGDRQTDNNDQDYRQDQAYYPADNHNQTYENNTDQAYAPPPPPPPVYYNNRAASSDYSNRPDYSASNNHYPLPQDQVYYYADGSIATNPNRVYYSYDSMPVTPPSYVNYGYYSAQTYRPRHRHHHHYKRRNRY